jgi:hypothetical protein
MRSVQTQIALHQAAEANKRLTIANNRLQVIKIMMAQFQVQCNSLPEKDPIRFAIETFICAVTNAANGKTELQETSRILTR